MDEEKLKELRKIELRIEELKCFLAEEKNRLQSPYISKSIKKDKEQTIDFIEKK